MGLPVAPAFNLYDIREKCGSPPLCYNFDNLDKFLATEAVETFLNSKDRMSGFSDCNMAVHSFLLGDWMTSL